MSKRSLALCILLLAFWLVAAGSLSWQHIAAGLVLAFITVWFWHDLGPQLPRLMSWGEFVQLMRCLALLVYYVLQSNITVAKTLLFNVPRVSPVFVVMEPPLKTNWGRVLLATCITLTPGTVTIDVDPKTGQFIVHALSDEMAISLFYWKLIDEIKTLETYRQRRTAYVVDTGGAYGPDSRSALAGDSGTDSH
ncbi:MAG: Na+/H+ antiporter subunit E [Bacteroidales bacterium]|nr:Na+/H+ antiporter subunit E [Bacteroidales bacterium]HHY14912.1 Na+/H+ antiporter subunit E [Bacillota bacterium]